MFYNIGIVVCEHLWWQLKLQTRIIAVFTDPIWFEICHKLVWLVIEWGMTLYTDEYTLLFASSDVYQYNESCIQWNKTYKGHYFEDEIASHLV